MIYGGLIIIKTEHKPTSFAFRFLKREILMQSFQENSYPVDLLHIKGI